MGVPGLTNFLYETYRSYVAPLENFPITDTLTFDHIHLDLNAFLHTAARELKNKHGEEIDFTTWESTPPLFPLPLVEKLVQKTGELVIPLLEKCTARRSLFLAFDGPSAWAKMDQQRIRRWNQTALEQLITPGSPWMEEVERAFTHLVVDFTQKQHRARSTAGAHVPEIVVSGFRVPEEGEMKITQRILDCTRQEFAQDGGRGPSNATHLLVGQDSDLFLSCLAAWEVHNLTWLNPLIRKMLCVGSLLRAWVGEVRQVVFFPSVALPPRLTAMRMDTIFLFLLSGSDFFSGLVDCSGTRLWTFFMHSIFNMTRASGQSNGRLRESPPAPYRSFFLTSGSKIHAKPRVFARKRFLPFGWGLRIGHLRRFLRAFLAPQTRTEGKTWGRCAFCGHIDQKKEDIEALARLRLKEEEKKPWRQIQKYLEDVLWHVNSILKGTCVSFAYRPTLFTPSIRELYLFCRQGVGGSGRGKRALQPSPILRSPLSWRGEPLAPFVHYCLVVRSRKLLPSCLQDTPLPWAAPSGSLLDPDRSSYLGEKGITEEMNAAGLESTLWRKAEALHKLLTRAFASHLLHVKRLNTKMPSSFRLALLLQFDTPKRHAIPVPPSKKNRAFFRKIAEAQKKRGGVRYFRFDSVTRVQPLETYDIAAPLVQTKKDIIETSGDFPAALELHLPL